MDEKTDTECEPSPLPIPLNSKSETIGVQVQQKLESKEVPIHLVPKEIPTRSIIKRRGFGSKGQCIPLLANHFKVNVNFPDAIFYQYTVSVSTGDGKSFASKIGGRKLLDRVYHTYSSELANKRFAYDGEKTLYTVGPLPQNNLEFTVVLEETVADGLMEIDGESLTASNKRRKHSFSSRTFKVSLSYAAKIPLKSIVLAHKGVEVDNGAYDALRVLDTILRQQAANRGCLLVRQSFFRDDSRNFTDVGGGVTSVRGFHSSFRTTRGGLSLNMDVSTTMILTPGPVIDFLKTNQNVNDFHQIDWVKAKKMLKNLRIRPKHRNVEYKIIGLTEKICTQLFFPLKVKSGDNEEHLEISVFDYFTKHLGLQLSYSAYLPCIDVGKPKRPIYLPVELCSLVSLQRYTKDLSSVQRASLVEKSRLKPLERINSVTNALKSYRYEEDPLLSACGLSMEKELIEFEGRVLETPKLKVGNNEDCIARNGRWNFSNKTVQNPTRVDAWAIVNFSARGDTSLISRELINTGRRKGIHMERPHTLIEEDPLFRNSNALARVERMIEKMKDKLPAPPQLILCVLPQKKNCDIYGPWKKKCLSELGIVTQCISPSPSKLTDQYLTNVLLKINSKLGGVNSLLEFEHSKLMPLIMNIPTMIMGMDVSHGSPGQSGMPSIAAVVGSRCWPYISRYRASVRTQSPKVEMIDTLFKPSANDDDDDDDGIVRELLLDFYESSNQRKPKQIIVFRDGVSESQFNQVLDIELDQIIKAYQHLGEVDIPKFTVIVAQKNHHTKLFRTKGSENVPPGTVVDQTIVHPRNYDFYMCAHAGMMGTSKPAHYHVLLDEIGFSPDDLQKLIHSLSYVNQRTTTATSIVAPICYAHLAAKQMSHFLKLDDLSDTSSVLDSMTSSGSPCIPELPRLHEAVAGSMFFC